MTNKSNIVLYTGVTGNLFERVQQHKAKEKKGFTQKYNVTKLVYFEAYENPASAILREKQIKGGSRQKKVDLIASMNSDWRDLFEDFE